jgi:serralysin
VRTEVTGGDGDDNLVGAASTDTAVFLGDRADYTVEVLGGGVTQVTALASDEGVDLVQKFEFLRFTDTTLAFAGGVWA